MKIIQVTEDEIQIDSETECGPYTIFYIYERLRGTSYKQFNPKYYSRVKDNTVTTFRKYLFYKKPNE